MADLPKINLPEPEVIPGTAEQVIPATPDKEYPDAFIATMTVTDPLEGTQKLDIVFRPYNYTTKELYPTIEKDKRLSIADIYTEAVRVPVFAQTMGMIIVCSNLMLQEKVLVAKIANLTGAEKAAAEAELAVIRQNLGIV